MTWRIGVLHPTDVDAAFALSAAEGWNQSADDWRRLLRLEPDGCFAARAGVRMDVIEAGRARFARASQAGHGDEDMAAGYFASFE